MYRTTFALFILIALAIAILVQVELRRVEGRERTDRDALVEALDELESFSAREPRAERPPAASGLPRAERAARLRHALEREADPSLGSAQRARALLSRGAALLRAGDAYGALGPLRAARDLLPDSPVVCYVLAQAYQVVNWDREAVALLPCLRTAPGDVFEVVRPLVQQLERSQEFEAHFEAATSDHFIATYPSDGASAASIGAILDLLERARRDVASRSGLASRRPIPVVVYDRHFGAATGAPDWAGGYFDGKLRVPIPLLDEDPDRFGQMLAHEYVHALIFERTGARVPAWLHEGLANVLSDRHFDERDIVRRLDADGGPLAFDILDQSFRWLDPDRAMLAYGQSYQMVRQLIDERGWDGIEALLLDLETRGASSFEQSFEDVFDEAPEALLDRWIELAFGG